MKRTEEGKLLRIYLGESDRWHHQPLYEAIVVKAREIGLSGATVLRGPMSYGSRSLLHTAKILRLSADLPVVIEIVESNEKIEAFLTHVEEMAPEALVTLEKITIVRFSPEQEGASS